MKKIFTAAALLLTFATTNAQTTATNWTANDCNSVSHTLFSELDSGKVIVFVWVMPCASCVNGAKAAYNAVQSFATSNPGKVRYYLADDLGDATCSALTSWITTNSIGTLSNMTVFSNAGNVISESNFGGTGMPHVIVMGGSAHTIFYNKKGSLTNDQPGITTAITSAIGATATPVVSMDEALTVAPNPVKELFTVSYSELIGHITVTSVDGKIVKDVTFANGRMDPSVNLAGVAQGLYFVKIVDMQGRSVIKEVVKQ